LEARLDAPAYIDAPIEAGQRMGEVVYSSKGQVIRRVDIVAAKAVPRGNIFILVRDLFAKFFMKLFGAA
jgi:D-alanyl-D-alanine carboxypeptidase